MLKPKLIDQNLVKEQKENFRGVVVQVYPNLPLREGDPYFSGEDPIGLFDGENFWLIPFNTSSYKYRGVAEKKSATLSKLRGVQYILITYLAPSGSWIFRGVHPKKLSRYTSIFDVVVVE